MLQSGLRAQTQPSSQHSKNTLTLLQANVGNVAPVCSLQARSKLCQQDVEDRIAARIKAISPDIVSLQEILPDWICREGKAGSRGQACHNYSQRAVRDQVRRLLGDNYTIVCEPFQSWDCVAVKKDLVRVLPDAQGRSCPPGALCGTERLSGGDPAALNKDESYTHYRAATIESPLDNGFHIMAVDLELRGQTIRLINGHPQSGTKTEQSKARAEQIEGLFSRFGSGPKVLVAGDLNLDPFRQSDLSVQTFQRYVDNYGPKGQLIAERAFHYHSGPVEQPPVWPPRLTAHYLRPLPSWTYDHVLSNFMGGTCRVLLGAEHLSGGKGTDHAGVLCRLG